MNFDVRYFTRGCVTCRKMTGGGGRSAADRGAAGLARSNMIFGARMVGVEGRRSETGLDGAQRCIRYTTLFIAIYR